MGALSAAALSSARKQIRSSIRSVLPSVAYRSGISRAIAPRYRGRGVIFLLHSVVDDDTFYPEELLRCPAGRLDWTLRYLKANNVEIVSLDDAVARLSTPDTRPFAVFTFDDGYADNLTRALPVMERHNAPFVVYVTTGMVTGEIDAWWLGLAELIRVTDRVEVAGRRFDCASRAAKRRTLLAIEALTQTECAALPAVRDVIKAHGISCQALARREGLSQDQLRELARHPLVTIGAHTTTHINLAQASAAAAEKEMRLNRAFLEQALQRPVTHFAYPFGHGDACGPREAALAKSSGFHSAVTSRHGCLFPAHLDHLHELPREPLFAKDNAASLQCKLNGFYRAVRSRLGDPIATMSSAS
ncbi:MAG TPA: polysaccharide deacetylase family protein [Xanthobacteraceae bacterium]|nr:polysaccharide deacetylase family protein [Xanthobacteraceae bacterium]